MPRKSTCSVKQKEEDKYRGFNKIFMPPNLQKISDETDSQGGRSTAANIPGTHPRRSPSSRKNSPPRRHEDQGATGTCPVHSGGKKRSRKGTSCTCQSRSSTPQGATILRSRSPSPNRDKMDAQPEKSDVCKRTPPTNLPKAPSEAPGRTTASTEGGVCPVIRPPSPPSTQEADSGFWQSIAPLRANVSEDDNTPIKDWDTCSLARGLFSSPEPPKKENRSSSPSTPVTDVCDLPPAVKETERRPPRDQAALFCPRPPPQQQGAAKDRSRSPLRDSTTTERDNGQQCERDMQQRRPITKPQGVSDTRQIQDGSQTGACKSPENIRALAEEVCKHLYQTLKKGWGQEDIESKRPGSSQEQGGRK